MSHPSPAVVPAAACSASGGRAPRRLRRLLHLGLATGLLAALGAGAAYAEDPVGSEPLRPGFHYTPAKNWTNDPNGLVYHDGLYHLYYQYNPQGNSWGNMSWGHATSTDLMHWTEQPVAIGQTFDASGDSIEDIFSGSIVVDHSNTSGLGKNGEDPLIALYTSAYTAQHPTLAGVQAQSLAYSTDGGYTWEKYAGNPVVDRGSANFRDPKVFWYEGETAEESHWVMTAVEATSHQVEIFTSKDLKDWSHASTFGPANAVGGVWECPDLFELPVDGDSADTRWVMVVNLNPGAVAGGSGGQYLVGDFDGTTFTPDEDSLVEDSEIPAPSGDELAGFEGADFTSDGSALSPWTAQNETGAAEGGPFGTGPATGPVSGQQTITGFEGTGFVNSFHGGDAPVGTMESAPFTIGTDHLSFLIGGGDNPHVDGTRLDNTPPPGTLLWNGFEETGDAVTLADMGWSGSGDLAAADSPASSGGDGYIGDKRVNTWEGGPNGDANTGTLTSPAFTIDGQYLSMLVGGGSRDADSGQTLEVQLLVDGQVVRRQGGPDGGSLNWQHWDLSDLQGRSAQLRVVDEATGDWGHLTLDEVVMGDEAAQPRSDETAVNLLVDGKVVRTATGADSESMDWTSWDVSALRGQQASIQIVDNSRGGWGHVLADAFTATDEPAVSRQESYHWLDWGKDYYAAVSYSDAPDGRRIMTGWMNNWQYAGDVPVSPWRSAMTLPREVTLTRTADGIELEQAPVAEAEQALAPRTETVRGVTLAEGTQPLRVKKRALQGDLLKVDLTLDPGTARRSGVVVHGSAGFTADEASSREGAEGTLIGYDASTGRAFVDRTRSGATDFSASFPGEVSMPVTRGEDGTVTLSLWVDRSSVEVFGESGTRTMTEAIYPGEDSDALLGFAQGGTATLVDLQVTRVKETMYTED